MPLLAALSRSGKLYHIPVRFNDSHPQPFFTGSLYRRFAPDRGGDIRAAWSAEGGDYYVHAAYDVFVRRSAGGDSSDYVHDTPRAYLLALAASSQRPTSYAMYSSPSPSAFPTMTRHLSRCIRACQLAKTSGARDSRSRLDCR